MFDILSVGEYILVFILAAVPWIEIAVVIPVAILKGMNPLLVGLLSFGGNLITVFLLIIFLEKYLQWRSRRKNRAEEPDERSNRARRARAVWEKYGLPGLAFSGPLLLGSHIAALIGLTLGAKKHLMLVWMTVSLGIWTIVIAAAAYYGLGFLGFDHASISLF